MEKPSLEFFATLGQYVYQYIDSEDKVYYTGKGNGDRCWAHVTEKDYNPEHIHIVARNLEKFDLKKDGASFLLESYFISTQNPDGNSVAGHYKECFIMASLSSMFKTFVSEQHDMFENLPDWYTVNYDTFRGRLREIKITDSTVFFLSSARNKMYMMWYWDPKSSDPVKVTFEINLPDGEALTAQKKQMKEWLKTNGYTKLHEDGKVQKFAVFADSIEEVVGLFQEFMS